MECPSSCFILRTQYVNASKMAQMPLRMAAPTIIIINIRKVKLWPKLQVRTSTRAFDIYTKEEKEYIDLCLVVSPSLKS